MRNIVYRLGDKLYVNLTNKCPNRCTFCIRTNANTVGDSDSLWLDSEPDIAAVKDALNAYPLDDYAEIVFCGYGEPTEALPVLLDTARYLKTKNKTVRLNTNGLGDLINGKHIAPLLSGLIDIVSISLNTSDAAKYNDLCKPVFGVGAYQAMLDFARECKDNIPQTRFTIVDTIGADEIEKCRAVAETVGIPLNVRAKI